MPSATLTPGASSTDSSLTQLTNKKVARLFNDDQVVTLLLELELGVWQQPDGTLLIGWTDGEIHEHDRWLWRREKNHYPLSVVEDGGWAYAAGQAETAAHFGPGRQPLSPTALRGMLSFYKRLTGEVRMRLLLHEGRVVGASEVIAVSATLDSVDINDLVEVDYSLSAREIHDIVHHQAEFLARHPDHVGISRQHLLRMYGLADPYRAVRAGRENA